MTPAARIAAAIEILDDWRDGAAAEKVLTSWARGHRFAGSKDRAAIRDHVYEALRCARSFAALGGAETGRGLMIGALRAAGVDPREMFTGEGYGPPVLAPHEAADEAAVRTLADLPEAVRLDVPAWLEAPLKASLGGDYAAICAGLRHRAPVHLRVNLAKATRPAAMAALAEAGIETRPVALAETALEVTQGARQVQGSALFRDGIVELQDAASQAVVAALSLRPGMSVLDYCAGGGGKALAMAATGARVSAHDVAPGRMADLPSRAARAGIAVNTLLPDALAEAGRFDLVLADAPCSGSGAWRRAPHGKWALTPERLDELCRIQASILDTITEYVAPGGALAYATCSLLDAENGDQIGGFLARHPGWTLTEERRFTPLDGGDGFYCAVLTR